MKKIVTIGGGSGQFELLHHLKEYDVEISAVVTMMDDGGSTGKLREQLGVLPPGDVRRCLRALAQTDSGLPDLLEHRFSAGDLEGHTVGNIMISALEQQYGDFGKAVAELARVLNIKGEVLPVTFDQATLCATLEDGSVVEGETNIDIPQHDTALRIKDVFLKGDPQVNPAVLNAIAKADMIILTIGDVYTSVIPNLLVTGVADALMKAKGTLIYTCNQTIKVGETDGFTAYDYVTTLERYLSGRKLDTIVVNKDNAEVSEDDASIVRCDVSTLEQHGIQVVLGDVADGNIVSGEKLAKIVAEL